MNFHDGLYLPAFVVLAFYLDFHNLISPVEQILIIFFSTDCYVLLTFNHKNFDFLSIFNTWGPLLLQVLSKSVFYKLESLMGIP